MRHRIAGVAAVLVATMCLGSAGVRAEDAAPADPTRGHWDGYLDPVRDGEDWLANEQKSFEDSTKVHIGGGIAQNWFHNFNNPPTSLNAFHSLDPDHDTAEFSFAQLSILRPSDGFIPGFTLRMDVGRTAKRQKPDYNGNGGLFPGDTFEKNSFDPEELYATWTVPEEGGPLKGLTFKGGKFVTLLGAEVIEPWNNFNISRSFLFGYAIPFTHTGGLISYPISDKLSVTGGAVTGWDNLKDNNSGTSGIGNLTWAATDEATLSLNGIYGAEQTNHSGPKRGVIDVVATIKPSALPDLTLLLNYDYGHDQDAISSTKSAQWQGFALVGNYNFTPRCSLAARGEWFEDDGGYRTGVNGSFWEFTLTTKYLITQHASMRFEYRHDGASDRVYPANDLQTGPGGVTIADFHNGQDIAGFEFTYLFN